MFIWTAKLRRGRLAAGAAALLLALCGAVVLAGGLSPGEVDAVSPAPASPKGIKTNEDRVAYLESYGWTVSPEAVSVEELLIPEEFDETYDQYLALQAQQGFDLTQYKGKRVKRYTYEVTNYPSGEQKYRSGRRGPLHQAGRLYPRPGHAQLSRPSHNKSGCRKSPCGFSGSLCPFTARTAGHDRRCRGIPCTKWRPPA